LLNRCF